MRNQLRTIGRTITTPWVLAMISTVVTLIIVISPYASIRWRITWIACAIIAVLGLITIFRELRRQYPFDMARHAINELLVEGRTITDQVDKTLDKQPEGEQMIAEWCGLVPSQSGLADKYWILTLTARRQKRSHRLRLRSELTELSPCHVSYGF